MSGVGSGPLGLASCSCSSCFCCSWAAPTRPTPEAPAAWPFLCSSSSSPSSSPSSSSSSSSSAGGRRASWRGGPGPRPRPLRSASLREKLRMRRLARALRALRRFLPPSVAPPGQSLTKLQTLRLAARYIALLDARLRHGTAEEGCPLPPSPCGCPAAARWDGEDGTGTGTGTGTSGASTARSPAQPPALRRLLPAWETLPPPPLWPTELPAPREDPAQSLPAELLAFLEEMERTLPPGQD